MSTTIQTAGRDCINSLGIPVDNLSLEQAVDRVAAMARMRDGHSRLVSTLNVDFLVNSLGWTFSRPRHPELLEVLRNSDLVTADGFPIVWLSRIMGKPLKARVTGADLVPALAARAARDGLSIFLLGGGEGSAAAAAQCLVDDNPGLRIAGAAAPFIHTSGPQLLDCAEDDQAMLALIHASGADILLVGLGNPKQELWFNRNRRKLRVPVALGIGGTFEFINGGVRRAPKWVQNMNLEWAYRISQDPARLWRRYAKGLFKLSALTAPLLYYRVKEAFFVRRASCEQVSELNWQSVWSSRNQSLSVLRLPRVVSATQLRDVVNTLQRDPNANAQRLLDFSSVKHIQTAGHQEFFRLAGLLHDAGANISLLGMSPAVRRHLSACRILDLVGDAQGGNTLSALAPAAPRQNRFDTGCDTYVMSNTSIIFLSGRVSGENLDRLGFIECLQHAARDQTCIIDLRNVALLESTAIARLQVAVEEMHQREDGAILVSGAGSNARQMLRMSGLGRQVILVDDHTLLASIAAEGVTDA